MKLKELIQHWEESASEQRTPYEHTVRLPLADAAKLAALAEMYPGRTEEQLITDILSTALDEIEERFPYVQGTRVVAEDEQGDPIYADEGLTPRFKERTRKHLAHLRQELGEDA
ncbi:MAG: type 1 pili tip component [Halorhodospira sp.]